MDFFAGQRRGALRCINGVCRQLSLFEGAKLERSSQFQGFRAAAEGSSPHAFWVVALPAPAALSP